MENSLVTQTTSEATLLTLGEDDHAYQATQILLSSNPLILPFDTQVCHERQICLRFH